MVVKLFGTIGVKDVPVAQAPRRVVIAPHVVIAGRSHLAFELRRRETGSTHQDRPNLRPQLVQVG